MTGTTRAGSNVLVLGTSGFIDRHLVIDLLNEPTL